MGCVAVDGLHGSEVLVAHVKHLGTFPWSQMCWAVLQGGRLLILVPVLLQKHTHTHQRVLIPATPILFSNVPVVKFPLSLISAVEPFV